MGMKATVTSKGQITIPLAIRKRLKLQAGAVLDFDESAQCLVARRVIDVKKMRSVIGCAKSVHRDKTAEAWLDETRGRVALS